MNIHEYQAKKIFEDNKIPVPKGSLALSGGEAKQIMIALETKVAVVKAQIHSGGRGKAGGVKLARSPEEAQKITDDMIGIVLKTHQTGPEGKMVRKVYIEAGSSIEKEYYLALTLDRESASIGIMFSTCGGMDIEEVAKETPEKLVVVKVDPTLGLQNYHIRNIIFGLKLPADEHKELTQIIKSLYALFVKYDYSMLEINPLIVDSEGKMFAVDGKMNFDDNALFRHPDIEALRDPEEEDPREVEAAKHDLSYIGLSGNIACLVNGAGLAMATMDIIKYFGGEPANFLDVGGSATQESVTNAFKILIQDKQVKSIFVNIFGGIMKCDTIASGIVAAVRELRLTVPMVVRLEGTNVNLGKKILSESGLALVSADDMADGARKAVELAKKS